MSSKKYGLMKKSACTKKRTQGETQTPKGFGFPQRLSEREREKKKKRKRRRRTNQTTRERERTNKHLGWQGSGPKGHQTKQNSNPRDQENHTEYPNIQPRETEQKPNTDPTKSRRTCHRRVEGPMGRPALLGSHPRGPQYRGVQVPPHYGNRPRWRKSNQSFRHETETPKALSWRLASPHVADTNPTPTWMKGITRSKQKQTRQRMRPDTNSDIRTAGGLLSGGAARRRPQAAVGTFFPRKIAKRIAIACNF